MPPTCRRPVRVLGATSVFTTHLGIDPMPPLDEALKDFVADALAAS